MAQIGADFAQSTGLVRTGKVGGANALLMPQRDLVDFAVRWMEQKRSTRQ
jgi:aminoglycoside 3-N-acetyltransferase